MKKLKKAIFVDLAILFMLSCFSTCANSNSDKIGSSDSSSSSSNSGSSVTTTNTNIESSSWTYPTTTPKVTWSGIGTATDPYLISTAQQLADLAYFMCEEGLYYNKSFALANDIDLNEGITVNASTVLAKRWIAIGSRYKSKSKPFQGTFDGRGHKITGLYIKNPGSHHRSGLFGYVEGGTIKNLVMGQGYVEHNNYSAGAIVSMLCGGTMIACGNEGTQVVNTGGSAGGLVGRYENSGGKIYIIDSYNIASVIGSTGAGGIVGYAQTAQFYNSYNAGDISGDNAAGIAGDARNANFYNCYNSGSITGKTKSAGIANTSKIESSINEGRIKITNCYNKGLIASGTYKGAISNEAYNKSNQNEVLLYCYYEASSANSFDGYSEPTSTISEDNVVKKGLVATIDSEKSDTSSSGSNTNTDMLYNGKFDSPASTITTHLGYCGTLIECLNAFVEKSGSLKGLQTWKTGEDGYPVFTGDSHFLPILSVESDVKPVSPIVTDEITDDNDISTKCTRCKGTGKCSDCGGKGKCPKCCNLIHGLAGGHTGTCTRCGGTEICTGCYGYGKCLICDGTGKK